jgi:hypothetical protein
MNQKYKKIIFFGVLGGLFLTFIFSLKISLAQSVSINYPNFKNLLYNFLNEQCPSGERVTQCNVYSVFYQANYFDIKNYKTRLYNAKTDDEIKTVLTEFFSEYCTPNYIDNKEFSKLSSASTLNFFCNCWSSPDENCTNLVNSLGSNLPPNSTWTGGPVSVSNVITNYVAGKNFKGEDTSCQRDLNVGLLDFFHNPISWFLRVIFWVFEQLLKLVADVFIWLLTPANFGGFVNFQPVKTIWRISLNLANLGIILGFLIVAIATILKIEKYSWDKMLWRLVLVALLVNFSLVLCGIFVDLSNFLTIYFLTGAGNQMLSFKDILASTASTIACAGFNQGFLYEASSALIGILVVIIFIGQIIGLISYTVIRIITLWLTLGLSPLFFLSLAFPGLEKIADSWKNYFTQAIVSLPVIAFSFFIILVMLNQIALSFVFVQQGEFSQKIISMISFGIIIIALSQAVLIIAGSFGIQQIQKGYKWATGVIWGALGFLAGSAYKGTAREIVKSKAWEQTAKRLEESGNRVLYRIGRTMSETRDRIIGEKIKFEREYLNKLDPVQTRNYIKRNIRNPDLVALGVNRLIELGQLSVDDQPYINIAKKSSYFRPPSDTRKNNFVDYTSLIGDDQKLKSLNNAQKTLNQYQNYGIDPNAVQTLGNENLVLFDIASTLKASDIEQQNWDDIWEKYLNTLSKQQRDTFLFGLVLSQGTKLAIIDQTARSHRVDIGKAIVDATYNHLKKLEPTAKLKDAVDFLLEDKVTIGKKVIVGLGGKINAGFKNWIITSSGI